MKLYPIYAMGIQAYCSDLIIDPGGSDTVYFMSIAGYQATVKGIMANLMENHDINVEIEGSEYCLTRASLGYKTQMRKLPSGLLHAVILPKLALPKSDESALNRFFVLTEAPDELLTLFFRHLDEKTQLPVHPSWTEWLWKIFTEEEGWMSEARTLIGSYLGYLFEFDQQKLPDLISDAIKRRVPDVIGCMEWKGGSGDGKPDCS